MANGMSLVSSLSTEVGVLLRHDNFDPRIYEWLSLALQDIKVRAPVDLFFEMLSGTILDTTFAGVLSEDITYPVALVVWRSSDYAMYSPKYVSPSDYDRVFSGSGDPITANVPLIWTIKNISTAGSTSQALWVYPGRSGTADYRLFHINTTASVPTAAEYLNIPYHFEHLVIFGAAAIGAAALQLPTAPIFDAEYEQALQDFKMINTYRPSSFPLLRSISGPYAGTQRVPAIARFPANISG
jgi:hypothetical protein